MRNGWEKSKFTLKCSNRILLAATEEIAEKPALITGRQRVFSSSMISGHPGKCADFAQRRRKGEIV